MKSRAAFFVLFSILLGEIFAQNRPFRFGIFLSPGMAYRQSVGNDANGDFYKPMFDDIDRPKISGSGGVFVERDLNRRNSLRAGFEFMNLGDQSKARFADDMGLTSANAILRQNFNYLAVPIDWRLVFYEGRCANFLNFGVAPAFFLSHSEALLVDSERIVSHDENTLFSKASLVGNFGFGFSFPINKALTMEFQPRARYFFTKLHSSDAPLSYHLWDAGVQVAVKF